MTAQPPRYRWLNWKTVVGCLLVLLASAATTSAFLFGQLNDITSALKGHKSVSVAGLASTSFGGPQTLLLVGDDTRSVFKYYNGYVGNLANEMLLVRFDPSKPWISMLSLPREMLTTIQCPSGPVANRLNYSLQCGGFTTLVSTVKQVTGLSVNHVIEINFTNFEQAIDEMGCVYSTIDRRYYHVNVPGGAQYQEINLQPGYQKVCGTQAEQFVSYRHGDTSLIRDARDQTFLLSAKQEYGPTLVDNASKFERILGKLVSTDAGLKTDVGIEDLLSTLIQSAGLPVRQVQVGVNLDPTDPTAIACACVTASPGALRAAANSFLYGASRVNRAQVAATAQQVKAPTPGKKSKRPTVSAPALSLAPTDGLMGQARQAQSGIPFPLEFPNVMVAGGAGLGMQIRNYVIHAPGGEPFPAYVMVFPTGLLGQYYDVQGTSWTTAPTLDNPAQSVSVGGTNYYVWYQGSHIEQVAWYEHHAAYWIRNSLTDGVLNSQMLAIAEQTAPVVGAVPASRSVLNLHGAAAPAHVVTTTVDSAWDQIGWVGGLAALVLLPLALVGIVAGRLRLRALRERAAGAIARAGEMETLLASAMRPGGAKVALAGLGRLTPLPAAPTAASRAAERIASRGGQRVGRGSGAPAGAGGSASSGSGASRFISYRGARTPSWLLPATAVVVVLAVAVALLVSLLGGQNGGRVVTRSIVADKPDVPVAVLNGGTEAGAAGEMATVLKHDGVNVTTSANLGAAPPVGLEVLYTPGEDSQARLVANLLKSQSPTVAPANPTSEGAAGATAKVIVVIP